MIPKFNETMLPILKFISDKKEYHFTEIVEWLYCDFQVTEEEKNLKSSNWAWEFSNKVWWGKSYLKQAWLVDYPKRWYTAITEEWLRILKEWPTEITVNFLKKYDNFVRFITPSKKDTQNIQDTQNIISDELTPDDLIEQGYKKFDYSLKKELLEKLMETNPYYFEKIILLLFREMWYWDFIETPKSWDGGIDGIINQDALGLERIYTQAKRYTQSNVWEKEIRNFIGAMSGDVSRWIFVTTSDFSDSAKEKVRDARNHKIILINGEKLVELMIKYNVWVQKKKIYEIKEIDWDFFLDD